MNEPEINLTEQERDALRKIAERTGKSEHEWLNEMLKRVAGELQRDEERRSLMQEARGIWKDRQDLPAPEDLRREWNRS
jgi:hypothetical protein